MLKRFTTRFAALLANEGGAAAMMFGLLLVPICLASGAALDYSRATNVRTGLQASIDAAVLGAARDGTALSKSEMENRVKATFLANFRKGDTTIESLDAVRNDAARTISLTARVRVKTTLMQIAGIPDIAIEADGIATWGRKSVEIALVLDNTGSMAQQGKMTALRSAVRNLLDTMEGASKGDPSLVKISIVPFNTQVQVDRGDLKPGSFSLLGLIGALLGANDACMADRDQPNDINVLNIGAILFPGVSCQYGDQLAKVIPLGNNYKKLRKTVDDMTPTGNTNVTIGAAWGLAALDANSQLPGAKPYGTQDLAKYMILLTDGDNTENRFENCQAGSSWDRAQCVKRMDARTAAACTEAKAKGITLYTIRVIAGNAGMLKDCASPGKYMEVKNAGELDPVFREIANQILSIRLTS